MELLRCNQNTSTKPSINVGGTCVDKRLCRRIFEWSAAMELIWTAGLLLLQTLQCLADGIVFLVVFQLTTALVQRNIFLRLAYSDDVR